VLIIEPGFGKVLDKPNSKKHGQARLLSEPGLDNNVFETNHMRLVGMVSQTRAEGFVRSCPKTWALPRSPAMRRWRQNA